MDARSIFTYATPAQPIHHRNIPASVLHPYGLVMRTAGVIRNRSNTSSKTFESPVSSRKASGTKMARMQAVGRETNMATTTALEVATNNDEEQNEGLCVH